MPGCCAAIVSNHAIHESTIDCCSRRNATTTRLQVPAKSSGSERTRPSRSRAASRGNRIAATGLALGSLISPLHPSGCIPDTRPTPNNPSTPPAHETDDQLTGSADSANDRPSASLNRVVGVLRKSGTPRRPWGAAAFRDVQGVGQLPKTSFAASLALSPTCLTSASACCAWPLASRSSLPVTLPVVSLTLPTASSAACLILSPMLMGSSRVWCGVVRSATPVGAAGKVVSGWCAGRSTADLSTGDGPVDGQHQDLSLIHI